jgi:hypothetical protein
VNSIASLIHPFELPDVRSSRVMRILHVISSVAPAYGGPSKAVFEMCRELNRRGAWAEIFTTDIDVDGRLAVPLGRGTEVGLLTFQLKRSGNTKSRVLWRGLCAHQFRDST